MRRETRWKFFLNMGIILLAALYILVPQFSVDVKNLLFGENHDVIRTGLDLKGGIELVLAPDYRVEDRVLIDIQNDLVQKIGNLGISEPKKSFLGLREENKYNGLRFTFASENEVQRVINAKIIPSSLDWDKGVEKLSLLLKAEKNRSNPNMLSINVQLNPRMYGSEALTQAKEIISRRVNSSGLSETDVRLDSKNGRIQVQLPGVASLDQAETLLKSTGRLNFRLDGKIVMYGDNLVDAYAQIDNNKGVPAIYFKFGNESTARFRDITSQNVGKVLSIYLDEEKLMDPVINEAIPSGEGSITLGSGASLKEAKESALLMKSGALPVSLRTIQNTQIAPTLGSEMIRQSMVGAGVGVLGVIIFMLIFYGLPGALANIALIGYAILNLALFAIFKGVLTLPGVAGFILAVGMAVDANIIIFERIKDELRNGKRMRSALDAGFDRAFTAIIDSNVTTILTALMLLIFGTGPIKGFAITLTLGIIISMFTAIVVSKNLLEVMLDKNPDKYVKYFGV